MSPADINLIMLAELKQSVVCKGVMSTFIRWFYPLLLPSCCLWCYNSTSMTEPAWPLHQLNLLCSAKRPDPWGTDLSVRQHISLPSATAPWASTQLGGNHQSYYGKLHCIIIVIIKLKVQLGICVLKKKKNINWRSSKCSVHYIQECNNIHVLRL